MEAFSQQTVLAAIMLFQRSLTACLRKEISYYFGLTDYFDSVIFSQNQN